MGLRDFVIRRATPPGGIDVDAALGLIMKGGVWVDVRTPAEYEAGHIPGSRLVEIRALAENAMDAVFADDPFVEPGTTLVLVCDTGLRSGHAVPLVRQQGLNAEFLADGLRSWARSGQPLLPGPPRPRR